jgi:Glycosyl transferase family 2
VDASARGRPEESSVAVWLPDNISYDATMSVEVPAFHRPSAKLARRLLPARALENLPAVTRMRRRQMRPREIASALIWLETAAFYGVERVIDIAGTESPVTELLGKAIRHTRLPKVDTRPTLTGAVIALNEEGVIADALESLAGFVDEIVVLDGGSTDNTVEIARTLGATVKHRAFGNDFAAQRNALLEHVRTPWVFMLDCDERVPPELGMDVVEVLRNSDVDAVVLPWLNLVDDDPVPTRWPDPHARVHRVKLRYRGALHEFVPARTAVYLPLNGPCVQHHKTASRIRSQGHLYDSIDPTLQRKLSSRDKSLREDQDRQVEII